MTLATPSMFNRITSLCGAETYALLEQIAAVAAAVEVPAYLVGGLVRDVLLGIRSFDIDIMIEGDAIEFATRLYANWETYFPDLPAPKKPTVFRHYGTAKLRFAQPLLGELKSFDFSSAREERYPIAGGKPEICFADLRADLQRRDFSINALAICLVGAERGSLIDFFGGEQDLQAKQIRVLHERSFIDDPARLLRALRFCARFEFVLEDATEELFRKAITERCIDTLPETRLSEEFRKAMAEPSVDRLQELMQQYGLQQQVADRL